MTRFVQLSETLWVNPDHVAAIMGCDISQVVMAVSDELGGPLIWDIETGPADVVAKLSGVSL